MGELKMFYAAADAAFVGGSLVPTGGHNVLEAAAVGAPVLFGPFMHNFKDIADRIVEQKAAILCQNEAALAEALLDLYEKPAYRQELVAKGKQFIEQNQGTLNRIYAILETAITKLPGQENWPN
jgi:3-deoxy-D-manno-octulosonic-acid transferase